MKSFKEIFEDGTELAYLSNQAYDAWRSSLAVKEQAGNIRIRESATVETVFNDECFAFLSQFDEMETSRLASDTEAVAKRNFQYLLDRVGKLIGPNVYCQYMNPQETHDHIAVEDLKVFGADDSLVVNDA